MSRHSIQLTVNGEAVSREVPGRRLLADFLRDDLHLTGTKRGCETGTCGACTVLKDGVAIKSCLSLAVQCQGAELTTVEGLAEGDTLHPVQESFMNCGGLQCGYCTPGLIMSTVALLKKVSQPTEAQVRTSLNGHLCRCTGYSQIVESVLSASGKIHGN
jgi:carbon-monoxide dehydrogenase small subunit